MTVAEIVFHYHGRRMFQYDFVSLTRSRSGVAEYITCTSESSLNRVSDPFSRLPWIYGELLPSYCRYTLNQNR
jgi:hypothetical protein